MATAPARIRGKCSALSGSPKRFNELNRTIAHVSQRMLTRALRDLEYDQPLTRPSRRPGTSGEPAHTDMSARATIPHHLEGDCRAVASVLARIGDKWSVLVIRT